MIVIRNSTLINGAILAGLGIWLYHLYKKDKARREEFKEYRKEKLKGFDDAKLISEASICNDKIEDTSDRAYAREIMEEKRRAVYRAFTKNGLDTAYDDFMHTHKVLTTRSAAENKADIEYYRRVKEEERVERERRRAEMLEREKMHKYTSTAVDIASMAFNKGGITI